MFEPALRFLVDTAFGLVTYGFLLRFAMQWLRAPFRNPLGQFITALTNWLVLPTRRFIQACSAWIRRVSCSPG